MKDDTKNQALQKLDEMLPLVAYPEEHLDDKKLDHYHKDLKIYPDSFLRTMLSYNIFSRNTEMKNLRKPVTKFDWTSTIVGGSSVVNAYYNPFTNSIRKLFYFYSFWNGMIIDIEFSFSSFHLNWKDWIYFQLTEFPAAILQGAFFNADNPAYLNYAGIGFVVGHEMTHGFDDLGRKFNKNGTMVDWWDSETEKKFLSRAECIVKQYDSYTVKEVNMKVSLILFFL